MTPSSITSTISNVHKFQSEFRLDLITYHKGCQICHIELNEVLVASHIKPHSNCINDIDKLSYLNGLLLCSNHDKLFDRGLITFDDAGNYLISDFLNQESYLEYFKLSNIRLLNIQQIEYMRYPRNNVFKR